MRPRIVPAMVLAILAAPAAQAQEPLQPELDVSAGTLRGEAEDGIAPMSVGELAIPWTLAFPTAATAATELAQDAAITWAVSCNAPIGVVAPPTVVEPSPGTASYSGEAVITLDPEDGTPGVVDITCDITGHFTGATTEASDAVQSTVRVLFDGDVAFVVQDAQRKSGPQKMIRYPIEVTNNGNARALVSWELLEGPKGRWNVLLPEQVIVLPGETLTAIVAVATPYENGYVSDEADFVLRAQTSSPEDPDQAGPSADLALRAKAEGWYVPGPAPVLVIAALAAAAAIARRR